VYPYRSAKHVDCNSNCWTQLWLLLGACSAIASVSLAIWIHVEIFVKNPDVHNAPGVAIIIHTLLVLVSSLVC
jgi:hypothetical protein